MEKEMTVLSLIRFIIAIMTSEKYCWYCGIKVKESEYGGNWSTFSRCENKCKAISEKTKETFFCVYCGEERPKKEKIGNFICVKCKKAKSEIAEKLHAFLTGNVPARNACINLVKDWLERKETAPLTMLELNKIIREKIPCSGCGCEYEAWESAPTKKEVAANTLFCRICRPNLCIKHLQVKTKKGFCLKCEEEKIREGYAQKLEELERKKKYAELEVSRIKWEIKTEEDLLEKSIENIECEKCGNITNSIHPLCAICVEAEKEKIITGRNACKKCGKRNDQIEGSAYEIVFDPKEGKFFKKYCSICTSLHASLQNLGGGRDNTWIIGNVQKDPGFYSKMR